VSGISREEEERIVSKNEKVQTETTNRRMYAFSDVSTQAEVTVKSIDFPTTPLNQKGIDQPISGFTGTRFHSLNYQTLKPWCLMTTQ
jgi:hypothetical protein